MGLREFLKRLFQKEPLLANKKRLEVNEDEKDKKRKSMPEDKKETKKVALSACLYGVECRYDATDNKNVKLLNMLYSNGYEIALFCPEDSCFGTPRPTMDLVDTEDGIKAISNLTGGDLTPHIEEYAKLFFETNGEIELFIGKDRSPSCGVKSAKIYSRDGKLLKEDGTGVMARCAKEHCKIVVDANKYLQTGDSEEFL